MQLYRKYMQVHDAWLSERAKVKELEGYIEQIASEVQGSASALEREQEGGRRLQEEHRSLLVR